MTWRAWASTGRNAWSAAFGMVRDTERRVFDGRIAAALGDLPLHHDMAVEDRAHGVGDRFVMVVAHDQNREQAGDGALPDPGPGSLQDARQLGEHGRREALGGGRLTGGQPDLAHGLDNP